MEKLLINGGRSLKGEISCSGAKNAALLACQILGVKNPALREAMIAYKVSMGEQVHQSAKDINKK